MNSKRVRWTARAARRRDQIGGYIARVDGEVAERVVTRLVAAADLPADFPERGRIGRIKGTREVVLTDIPYIIAYRVGQDIEIITVMHTHQQWPSAF